MGLNTRLEVRKVAVLPDDAPVILGWNEGALEAVKALSQPRRVSPIKASLPEQPISILQRCDRGSGTSRELAYLPLAQNPKLAGQIAWSLYVTPFTTDLRGNIYFSTADGHLHIQPSRGGQWAEKLPPTTEELQIVQNILAHPDGYVLVEVNEGPNLASEEEKAEGAMLMLSPNVRVFAYDGRGFEEVYSGREIQNLVGVFSDGSWVDAIKKRTSIDLARFEPPLRQ